MASTETTPPAPETETVEETSVPEKVEETPTAAEPVDKVEEVPPEVKTPADAPPTDYFALAELLLGIVAAATGSGGAIAYTGLKGDSHVGWEKICNVYDKFCRHVVASVFVSLFASIVLVFLVSLSFYSPSKKIPK